MSQYGRWPNLNGSGGVTSLNSLTGALTLSAGSGISITPSGGNTLTIAETGPGANAITALTGDGTAMGPGSAALTLATVNSDTGGFGTASSVGSFIVNGKGLIIAAINTSIQISESQVTNLVSDLAGKQPLLTPGSISTSTTGITIGNGAASTVGPNVTVDIQTASGSQPGLLSSTDWTTFNNKQAALTIGNLTDVGTDGITITGGTGAVIGTGTSISQHVADTSHNGYLDASDWNTFNNKLDASRFNYITNPDAEINTTGWNLYNDSGRTVPASLVNQDITYTSTLSGGGGNGVEIEYIYNASFPSSTPNINVISSTHVQVQWNNGPTVSNNPTATQLQTAWNAVPSAVAIATIAITGTPTKLQYIVGAEFLSGGGDTSPVDGTGGVVAGVTLTRNTSTPLQGVASFDLGKDAANREGQGVSTDFIINSLDKGQTLQINIAYEGSSGMVLGASSDVQIFMYDITNAVLIPVTPLKTLAGPVNTIKEYTGQFVASVNSVNYRLILHIATANATAWDLLFDNVVVNDVLTPQTAVQVPSVVLLGQAISGSVTDHMAVMWTDGASQWVPCTSVYGNDYWSMIGFATNIVGSTASIFVHGYMDGFSFGPFSGYNQYVDPANPGGLTPLPSPFTDTYVIMGKAISATAINIQVFKGIDLIVSSIATPVKGGLLTNDGANDGDGDEVLLVGANGNVLVANSAVNLGLNWAPAVVAAAPFTYVTSTMTLTAATATNSVAGFLSAADHTTFSAKQSSTLTSAHILVGNASNVATDVAMTGDVAITNAGVTSISAATVTGKLITGYVSGAGTVAATDTILQAIQKLNGNDILKQSSTLTSAHILVGNGSNVATDVAMTGDVAITNAGVTSISAATVTGKLITGYVSGSGTVAATDSILQAIQKLNGNALLLAPLASPTFTGDVNVSTGNLLISTIGKGPQVKTGTNAKIGTAVLVGGTVTVANTSVTANSRIFVTSNVDGGTPGWLRVSAKTVGTSFVITSSSVIDTSTVAWYIVESIP